MVEHAKHPKVSKLGLDSAKMSGFVANFFVLFFMNIHALVCASVYWHLPKNCSFIPLSCGLIKQPCVCALWHELLAQ